MLPFVLAIEPDARQSAAVRRILRQRVRVDAAVVDSKDAAIAAIDRRPPDLILLSALFSPRDEADLFNHLRQIGAPAHLQSLTIPLLAAGARARESKTRGGLFTSLRRKKSNSAPDGYEGCDPEIFAEQISGYLRDANVAAEESPPAEPIEIETVAAPEPVSEPLVEPVEIEAAAPEPVSEPLVEPVIEAIVEDEPIHDTWSLTAPSDHIEHHGEDRAGDLPAVALDPEVSWCDESEPLLLALMEIEPRPRVAEPGVLAEEPAPAAVVQEEREEERADRTPEIELEVVEERAAAADAEPAAEEWLLRTIDRLKRDLRQSRPDVPAGKPTVTPKPDAPTPAPRVAAWPVFPLPAGHARPHEGARAFPLSMWARAAAQFPVATATPSRSHGEEDWRRLLQDTALPTGVRSARAAGACRIRIRRVPAAKTKRRRNPAAAPRPVIIVSRRALREIREARTL